MHNTHTLHIHKITYKSLSHPTTTNNSRREKLLSVTSKDVNEAVEKYLTNDKKSSTTILGVLPEDWKKDKKISEELGWEVIG